MAGGPEFQLMELINKLMKVYEQYGLANGPARELLFEQMRQLSAQIEAYGQAYPQLRPIISNYTGLLNSVRTVLTPVAVTTAVSNTWIHTYTALAARNAQILQALRRNQQLMWVYRNMTALRAAGQFARANMLRTTLIEGLAAMGITVSSEVTLPLLAVGALVTLAGCSPAPAPRKLTRVEELQEEYRQYCVKMDVIELKIAGVHLGPSVPRLSFPQYVALHHRDFVQPLPSTIELRW